MLEIAHSLTHTPDTHVPDTHAFIYHRNEECLDWLINVLKMTEKRIIELEDTSIETL